MDACARADEGGDAEAENLECGLEYRFRPGTKAFCVTCGVTFTRRSTDAKAVAAWWAVHKAGIQHRRKALARTHFGTEPSNRGDEPGPSSSTVVAMSCFEDEAEVRRDQRSRDDRRRMTEVEASELPLFSVEPLLEWTASNIKRELVVHAGMKVFGEAFHAVSRAQVEKAYYGLALEVVKEAQQEVRAQRTRPLQHAAPSQFAVGRDVVISGRPAYIACWAGAIATGVPLAKTYDPRVLWIRTIVNTSSLAKAAPVTAALCLLLSALTCRTIWSRLSRVFILLHIDDNSVGDGSGEARPVHASPEVGVRLVRRLSHHCDALLRAFHLEDFHFENFEYLGAPTSSFSLIASAQESARAHRREKALLVLTAQAKDPGCLFAVLPADVLAIILRRVVAECRISNRCIDESGFACV